MSSGTNAFPSRAGFNQSGGAHFMTLTPLFATNATTASAFANVILNASSNSGGAFSNATFVPVTASNLVAASSSGIATNAYNLLSASNIMLKDMGRTVVSSGRTFRKFAPVFSGAAASTFGVTGGPGVSPNTGYANFYLEVGREGVGVGAPIVRYF